MILPYFLEYRSLRISQRIHHEGEENENRSHFYGEINFTKSETKDRRFMLNGKL